MDNNIPLNQQNLPIINTKAWLPSYSHNQQHIYILLTSLNLGGAEKIVSDQLWENYYSKYPKQVTLIVIYEKQKEHSLPPNVNIVRLNNNIKNGELLFKQIAYEKKPLVTHLINDIIATYLFELGLYLHFVIHNDKRGWSNSVEIWNHPQTISLTAVAKFVKQQLIDEGVSKPIYSFRHHIKQHNLAFNIDMRQKKRNELNIKDTDIVIGMIGRICQQKNYFFAIDVLAYLLRKNPNYKLLILGGYEPQFFPLYLQILQKINSLKLHNNVIIPGFKTDPQNWLNAFDIGLNTSYFEGLSMATQEFMRNGLPMIVSKVCGQPEIIDNFEQLTFYDLPEQLDTPITNRWHLDMVPYNDIDKQIFPLYFEQIKKVARLIQSKSDMPRYEFNENMKKLTSFICYGSHNTWNLLNNIYSEEENKENNIAFITSNLNAGGAQRSLVNLLSEFKEQNIHIPLILLNQSNQKQYFNEIISKNIEYYLCHENTDVFNICSNLFYYLQHKNINKIIFWNVDAKMKLLISKFLSHKIKIIDVSPGDYIIEEMNKEALFQESIYYSEKEYYKDISHFVSKYHNTHMKQEYLQWITDKTSIIPNGVYFPKNIRKTPLPLSPFKILVCGRISPSKHLDTIFSAFKQFLNKYSNNNIYLDCFGSVEPVFYEYYEKLNKEYKDLIELKQINWMGHHDNPTEIMNNYHAIIVLGTHQGSPNVVLEAATCHLPIIANDSGGTKEIINDNTGILLPQKPEIESLYLALINIYENYAQAWEKAHNCYCFVEQEFSMKKMANDYLTLIRKI